MIKTNSILIEYVENRNHIEAVYNVVIDDENSYLNTIFIFDIPFKESKMLDDIIDTIKYLTGVEYDIFEEHTIIGSDEMGFTDSVTFKIKDKSGYSEIYAGKVGELSYDKIDIHTLQFNKFGYNIIIKGKENG